MTWAHAWSVPRCLQSLMRRVRRSLGDRHPGERCWSVACCGRRLGAAFQVADRIWVEVIGDLGTTRCLSCFDRVAEARRVAYQADLISVSWSDWRRIEAGWSKASAEEEGS